MSKYPDQLHVRVPPQESFEKYLLGKGFTERDLKEIAFSRLYVQDFNHGTVGHNDMLIIARLADLLEATEPLTRVIYGVSE